MHQPLLKRLKSFQPTILQKGVRLFHGCIEKEGAPQWRFNPIQGERKWLSSKAKVACCYAFDGSENPGKPHLFVCETTRDIPALIGSQNSLKNSTPWLPWEFPHKLPDEFANYASHIFGHSESFALLDHADDGSYNEILVTSPAKCLRKISQHLLPIHLQEAERFVNAMYPNAT